VYALFPFLVGIHATVTIATEQLERQPFIIKNIIASLKKKTAEHK
jgi:hypothetical protein